MQYPILLKWLIFPVCLFINYISLLFHFTPSIYSCFIFFLSPILPDSALSASLLLLSFVSYNFRIHCTHQAGQIFFSLFTYSIAPTSMSQLREPRPHCLRLRICHDENVITLKIRHTIFPGTEQNKWSKKCMIMCGNDLDPNAFGVNLNRPREGFSC